MLPDCKRSVGIAKRLQDRFAGLDMRPGAAEGSLSHAVNLTSEHYPLLASRTRRRILKTLTAPQGMTAADGLICAAGGVLYDGETSVCALSGGEKTLLEMGRTVLVFPDKLCYDRVSGTVTHLESRFSGTGLCFEDGTIYGESAEGNTIRAVGVAWSTYFKPGDAVTIRCCTVSENNKTAVIREIDGDELHFSEHCFAEAAESGTVYIERTLPEMDVLCVHDNRLYGAKDDTVYASALGDPTNFNRFDGTGTDSFAASTGTPGRFTGAIAFLGCPVFFKETAIFKLYGDRPENYELLRTVAPGVRADSAKSLAVTGELCCYLGREGVYAYRGGVPRRISAPLGEALLHAGIGGSDGRHYYLNALDGSSAAHCFVYDTEQGIWQREDGARTLCYADSPDGLCGLLADGTLYCRGGSAGTEESCLYWQADFTSEGACTRHRRLIRLVLHIELSQSGTAEILASFDGGSYTSLATLGAGKHIRIIPLPLHRAEHISLRLCGTGEMKLYGLERQYAEGSERA